MLRTLPPDAAGLLVEFQYSAEAERMEAEETVKAAVAGLELLHRRRF